MEYDEVFQRLTKIKNRINKTNSFLEFHQVFVIYTVHEDKQLLGNQPSCAELHNACVEISSSIVTPIPYNYITLLRLKKVHFPRRMKTSLPVQ